MGLNEQWMIYLRQKNMNMKKRIVNAKKKEGWNLSKQQDWGVLVTPKLTNTPSKSTKDTSPPTKTMETQGELFPKNSRNLTCSLADSLAKVSALLESGEDSKIREALSSLKSLEGSKLKDLSCYFLRMSKDYSPTIRGIPLRQS